VALRPFEFQGVFPNSSAEIASAVMHTPGKEIISSNDLSSRHFVTPSHGTTAAMKKRGPPRKKELTPTLRLPLALRTN
jgi:hypothetical protein